MVEEARVRAEIRVEEEAVDAKRQEIRAVVVRNNPDEIKRKLGEVEPSATQALEMMERRAESRFPGAIDAAFEGSAANATTMKHHVKMTEAYVKEIVNAYKTNPALIPVGLDMAGRTTLNNLLTSLENPENDISSQTAPYVYKIIQRAVNNRFANPLEALSENELKHLYAINDVIHKKVSQALAQAAQESRIDAAEIQRFKAREEARAERGEGTDFEQEWIRDNLNKYYDESDKPILKALYNVKEFDQFVQRTRREIERDLEDERRLGRVFDADEADRRISDRIQTQFVLLFSKLYRRVDIETPTIPFEEVIRSGLYSAIETVSHTLKSRLELLAEAIEREGADVSHDLRNMRFFKLYSEERIGEKEIMVEGKPVMQQQVRMIPSARSTEVKAKEFINMVYIQVGHEIETKAYLHNIGVIFSQPAGKDGVFWPAVAGYAERMKSSEIDNIMNLPDKDIFMTGFRLYTKYVEEAFAQVDWVHQTNMFTPDLMENTSKIERRVYEDLQKMFPDRIGRDEWRLRRAMTIAKGLARGIFFSEIEDGSWADPALNEKGEPSYGSYGRNDSAPYNALNPLHHFLRWQSEQVGNMPLVFCPVSGVDPNFYINYDHRKLWNLMKAFQESFLKGNEALRKKSPDQRLFMEILINVAKMGGLQSRGGWRNDFAYEGWIHYKSTEDSTRKRSVVNYYETWRSIENIGYELLFDFVVRKANQDDLLLERPSQDAARAAAEKELREEIEKKVDEEIKQGNISYNDRDRVIGERMEDRLPGRQNKKLRENAEDITDRKKFFEYIYKKYINPGVADADIADRLAEEVNRMKTEVKGTIDEFIKKGIMQEADKEKEITREAHRRLMYRALVGVIRDRMPTKFVRIERDRFTKDGERAWLKLRNAIGWSNEEMDEAMKNLALVETKLREETTVAMHLYLRKGTVLNNFETNNYVVNEANIERILGAIKGISADSIKKAVNLHRKIREDYFDKESFVKEMAEKIRPTNAAGYQRDRDFPFALGTEELEASFLSYRNSGPRTLARAVGEIGQAETVVFKNITHMVELLRTVAVDEKHDISKIVESIGEISKMMEGIHGKDPAYKLSHHLSMMVITFFKKDAAATGMFSKFFRTGQFNSLAARFTGLNSGVWEWDEIDIRNFVKELERNRIIAKDPFDYNKSHPSYIQKPIKLFGLKLGEAKVRKPDYEYFSGKLSRDAGADNLNLIKGAFNKYFLIFWAILLFHFIRQALKESEGKKD